MECGRLRCPFALLTTPNVTPAQARKLDHLEFIFEQRVCLFNTRRDHEWKIFFGALLILGAVDYRLLTMENLHHQAKIWWTVAVIALFTVTACYQWGVQTRNHADRLAMDAICQEICTDLPIRDPERRKRISFYLDCSVNQKSYPDVLHITYLWAFCCQVIVLIIACAISIVIPYRV